MSKAAELAALIGSGQAQGNRNLIINGAMTVVAQRGTSLTVVKGATTIFLLDRFRMNTSGATAGQIYNYSNCGWPKWFC